MLESWQACLLTYKLGWMRIVLLLLPPELTEARLIEMWWWHQSSHMRRQRCLRHPCDLLIERCFFHTYRICISTHRIHFHLTRILILHLLYHYYYAMPHMSYSSTLLCQRHTHLQVILRWSHIFSNPDYWSSRIALPLLLRVLLLQFSPEPYSFIELSSHHNWPSSSSSSTTTCHSPLLKPPQGFPGPRQQWWDTYIGWLQTSSRRRMMNNPRRRVRSCPLQLNLQMQNEGEGDTSTFVLNGEWHLLGTATKKPPARKKTSLTSTIRDIWCVITTIVAFFSVLNNNRVALAQGGNSTFHFMFPPSSSSLCCRRSSRIQLEIDVFRNF